MSSKSLDKNPVSCFLFFQMFDWLTYWWLIDWPLCLAPVCEQQERGQEFCILFSFKWLIGWLIDRLTSVFSTRMWAARALTRILYPVFFQMNDWLTCWWLTDWLTDYLTPMFSTHLWAARAWRRSSLYPVFFQMTDWLTDWWLIGWCTDWPLCAAPVCEQQERGQETYPGPAGRVQGGDHQRGGGGDWGWGEDRIWIRIRKIGIQCGLWILKKWATKKIKKFWKSYALKIWLFSSGRAGGCMKVKKCIAFVDQNNVRIFFNYKFSWKAWIWIGI